MQKTKKSLAMLLCVVMLVSQLSGLPLLVSAADTVVTITSADSAFSDVSLTLDQLKEHTTQGQNWVKNSSTPKTYATVEGITLTDLLTNYVTIPSEETVVEAEFIAGSFASRFVFEGESTNSAVADVMLLWSAVLEGTGVEDITGGQLYSAMNEGRGNLWAAGVTEIRISLSVDAPGGEEPDPGEPSEEPTHWNDVAETAVNGTDYIVDASGNYTVNTALGLAYVARIVNTGDPLAGKMVMLASDIDIGSYYWVPIGQLISLADNFAEQTGAFRGTFDGAGHYISNLTIGGSDYNTSSGAFSEANALFGVNIGTVKNVGVVGVSVDTYRRGAGIAGINFGNPLIITKMSYPIRGRNLSRLF